MDLLSSCVFRILILRVPSVNRIFPLRVLTAGAVSLFLNITGAIAPMAPVLNTPLLTSDVIYGWLLIAYGAAKDRSLGIPGEDSKNVISARNFVGYYNGLPEDIDLDFSLDTDHAVIVGLGNVAIDVAR